MTGSWPTSQIDHVDLNGLNNKWDNLRLATPGQNNINRKPSIRNKSGKVGISWHPTFKRWDCRLLHNGKLYRSYHKDFDEACKRYDELLIKHYGEYARVKQGE